MSHQVDTPWFHLFVEHTRKGRKFTFEGLIIEQCQVTMGPVEHSQHKGHLPQYTQSQLQELQWKFDEFEIFGIFRCPEDIDITIEYLNLSFLIKEPSVGYRLVTAFANMGCYSNF